MKAKILRVRIEREVDDNPDFSYLGEYGNSAETEWAIDREARGDRNDSREYRYWNPGPNHIPPGQAENWAHVPDNDVWEAVRANNATLPDGTIPSARQSAIESLDLAYIQQDYERCEAYNRQVWCYLGIIAKAEVRSAQGIVQTLRSGGLWGVESDSGESYLEEVGQEQLTELRAELEGYGFSARAIDYAFRHVETED